MNRFCKHKKQQKLTKLISNCRLPLFQTYLLVALWVHIIFIMNRYLPVPKSFQGRDGKKDVIIEPLCYT